MNKVIQTGICSFGMSGKIFHAPFLEANPHFHLAAIVERHREESKEIYPQAKLYRSVEELLKDDALDLVVVNTPVQTHFEYVKAALEAGKNVVVEKPFTVNAGEAMELERLAKEKDLFLSVYQNRRYDGDYNAVKDVVAENLLGELKEAEIHYDRFRPEPSGKAHKEGDLPGTGIVHDLGAHLIDQAIQLFGFPDAIFADILTMRKGVAGNDYFEILFYYNRAFRVRLKGTLFAKKTIFAYILHGENGTFMQERSDLQEAMLQEGAIPSVASWVPTPAGFDGILDTVINGKEEVKQTRSEVGNYMNYYEDVYGALVHGYNNPVQASEAVLTMRVIDAALQSNREKRVVAIP